MNRRDFFASISGAAAVAVTPAKPAERRLVDVSDVYNPGHQCSTRVLLDGRDISNICYRAELYSDGTGTAFCHRVVRFKEDGSPAEYAIEGHGEDRSLMKQEITGRLEIIRPQPVNVTIQTPKSSPQEIARALSDALRKASTKFAAFGARLP